MIIKRC